MFIDDITIKVKAGRGGDGVVAFNKNKMSLGPVGGTGGHGGSVYIEAVSDLGVLIDFRRNFLQKMEKRAKANAMMVHMAKTSY